MNKQQFIVVGGGGGYMVKGYTIVILPIVEYWVWLQIVLLSDCIQITAILILKLIMIRKDIVLRIVGL